MPLLLVGVYLQVPLLGTSVRTVEPPEDSPVKREDVMKMLATTLGGRFMDLRMAMLTLAEERQRNLLATVRLILFCFLKNFV